MKRVNYLTILHVDTDAITPIYKQLADAIVAGIESGRIARNDILPSLHDLCTALDISKNSVERAYNELKQRGLVASVHGKGYYIKHIFEVK